MMGKKQAHEEEQKPCLSEQETRDFSMKLDSELNEGIRENILHLCIFDARIRPCVRRYMRKMNEISQRGVDEPVASENIHKNGKPYTCCLEPEYILGATGRRISSTIEGVLNTVPLAGARDRMGKKSSSVLHKTADAWKPESKSPPPTKLDQFLTESSSGFKNNDSSIIQAELVQYSREAVEKIKKDLAVAGYSSSPACSLRYIANTMKIYAVSAVVFTSSLLYTRVLAASADDWTKRSIYQVVTDRFALGNGSSPSCDTSEKKYCGGNWQGIISKLDYIQGMGFDAIWISPVVENVEGTTVGGDAYHGYWAQNINSLNANFGSDDDLKNLSSALHERGMYLMVDVVVNHLVAVPTNVTNVWPETFDYSLLQPFGESNSFHHECFISNYNNQTNIEQCWLGDSSIPLLDLDTENSTIVDTMYSWIKNLVTDYHIDGLRVDTVKHVRQDFWPDFASNAGVYTVGEVFIGDVSYVAPYTKGLDSVLDYPTYFAVYNAFNNGTSGNLTVIADVVTQAQDQYNHGTFYVGSFVENQDNPRLQSTVSDQSIVKNFITWPFINDGIPILYYGQEQGYQGGDDPANREALWLSGFSIDDKPLLDHVKALNSARKQAISYNSSFLTTKASFISQHSPSTLAISKPPLLTLLTNGGHSSNPTWSIPSSAGLYGANKTLVDVLTCDIVMTGSDGSLNVTASSGLPKVLMPNEALNASGLCGSEANGLSPGCRSPSWVQF
ncbi:glycoside hydrolase superfamily [Lentinula aciculospora]|uniref:alpha-amylase n=1 Tax=Lentinula aciculospora TaxID=153920 RepID=A0A9W9A611_9AGAR|nr:glycoside hydrolase superfamily [Lentinula aciculospora]